MVEKLSKQPTKLSDFPPILRKVVEYKLNSGPESITFKDICDKVGVNYETFRSEKWKYKTKHNKDLDLYLYNHRLDPIKNSAYEIYSSITNKAISGALGQQKLVAELLGDIKNKLEIDHKITGLFACFSPNPNVMPEDIKRRRKEMKPNNIQVIDIDLDD
ncbi:hypothetical protein MYX76_08635 [Desulfobacterota bacterium AH_259_B03_O07]|nr:hypothetical protein [Desulfobacterota bacterium AH_259_B03_O07]